MTPHPSETDRQDLPQVNTSEGPTEPEWVAIARQHYAEKAAVQKRVDALLARIKEKTEVSA